MSLAPSTSALPRRELSIRAAAARLQTTERQVLRLLATGQLKSIADPGRALKVEAQSVETFLASTQES